MKKPITLFLVIAMVLSLVVSISAEDVVSLTEHYETKENGELMLVLDILPNSGITGMKITVSGNPDVLIKKVEAGTATRSGYNEITRNENSYVYTYESKVQLDGGSVLEITFYSNTITSEILNLNISIDSAISAQGTPVTCVIEDVSCVNPAYGNQNVLEQGQAMYNAEPEETTFVFPSDSETEAMTLSPEEIAKDAEAITAEGKTLPEKPVDDKDAGNISADGVSVPEAGSDVNENSGSNIKTILAIAIPSVCVIAIAAVVIVLVRKKKGSAK